MKKTALARRYALALIKIGREDASYERYGKDLRGLLAVFTGSPELYKVLLNPMHELEERKSLAAEVGAKLGVSEYVARFLGLLVESRKIAILEEICTAYFKMEDELAGRLRVTVEAPVEPGEDAKEAIRKKLEGDTGKEVILGFEKNPDLIGGMVIKVGNNVIDGSLRAQLAGVGEKMLRGAL
jgi:F-type H+-transporting ATPase subunit delta